MSVAVCGWCRASGGDSGGFFVVWWGWCVRGLFGVNLCCGGGVCKENGKRWGGAEACECGKLDFKR